jgi:transposase
LILNQHCQRCLFRQLCVKEAEQQDNLSLLARMTPKVMQKCRKRGIFTVNQLSYAYRPRRRRKKPANAPPVFNVELQALAIRTSKIYLHEPPIIPNHPVELFLDIEGLPDQDLDYLIGLDVREDNQVGRYSFWADSADEEVGIFQDCLNVAANYPDAPVFHYGSYEPRAFARIAKKHGIKCEWFIKRLVNINAAVFGKVYFPVRSNRLKDVGAFVGAKWTTPDAMGLHSIAWRWHWEHTHEENYKELLLAYNRDDCHALRLLTAELQSIGQAAASRADIDFADAPKQNATPVGEEIHHGFDKIINSAHAEYRRNRIQFRSSRAGDRRGKPSEPSQRLGWAPKSALPSKIGKTIRVPRKRTCSRHPMHPLIPTAAVAERAMISLEFTKTGCRKTIIRYTGKKAECPVCHIEYNPPAIGRLQGRLFGHGFESWAVYHHVALRLPYSAISQLSADMFGEELNVPTVLKFMTRFAVNYGPAEKSLLDRILQSPFVHADETKINIKGISQYVWVLTDGGITSCFAGLRRGKQRPSRSCWMVTRVC